MKKLFILFLLPLSLMAQKKDSLGDDFIEKIYIRSMPIGIYTGASYLPDKITQNIEFG